MINSEFFCGLTIFKKVVNVNTVEENTVFVYQLVANGLDKPICGDSFESLEYAISAAAKSIENLLKTPGVVDPRRNPKAICWSCKKEEDDE